MREWRQTGQDFTHTMSIDMQTPLTLYDICNVLNSKPMLMLPLIPYSIYIPNTLSLKVINSQSLLYFSCQLVVWVEIGNWYFVPVSIRSYNFLPTPFIAKLNVSSGMFDCNRCLSPTAVYGFPYLINTRKTKRLGNLKRENTCWVLARHIYRQ